MKAAVLVFFIKTSSSSLIELELNRKQRCRLITALTGRPKVNGACLALQSQCSILCLRSFLFVIKPFAESEIGCRKSLGIFHYSQKHLDDLDACLKRILHTAFLIFLGHLCHADEVDQNAAETPR